MSLVYLQYTSKSVNCDNTITLFIVYTSNYQVLRAVISHFSNLIKSTQTDESEEVYLQKLSLSMSRCIIRPKVETALTLDDRHPVLLFADLVKNFEGVFKAADELKSKQREDR